MRTGSLVAAVLTLLALPPAAAAAAPNYILVTGPGLSRPVLLANWRENGRFLLAVSNGRQAPEKLGQGRPRLDLAEFWAWGNKPRPTKAQQANQHGSFYPARDGRRALIKMAANGVTVLRFASGTVLAILSSHGVPTRM